MIPFLRFLASSSHNPPEDSHTDDAHGDFGVHISFDDLFASVMFFATVWVMGFVAQRFLKMPSLVGEIFAGIILGPNVVDYVPNPEAFVMLGEIGCVFSYVVVLSIFS